MYDEKFMMRRFHGILRRKPSENLETNAFEIVDRKTDGLAKFMLHICHREHIQTNKMMLLQYCHNVLVML